MDRRDPFARVKDGCRLEKNGVPWAVSPRICVLLEKIGKHVGEDADETV